MIIQYMKKIHLLLFIYLITVSAIAQKDIFAIARSGTINEVKQLMKINPNCINEISPEGFSPLILSCYRNNNEVAKFLIETIEDINATSEMGTALMAATVKGNLDIATVLLDKKANPNLTDSKGITALMYAVQFRNINMIKLLLKYKADKTVVDSIGKTAFEYAAFSGNEEIINLLK